MHYTYTSLQWCIMMLQCGVSVCTPSFMCILPICRAPRGQKSSVGAAQQLQMWLWVCTRQHFSTVQHSHAFVLYLWAAMLCYQSRHQPHKLCCVGVYSQLQFVLWIFLCFSDPKLLSYDKMFIASCTVYSPFGRSWRIMWARNIWRGCKC